MKNIIVPCLAMTLIAAVELVALSMGVNGTMMALSLAAISGIGGFKLKSHLSKKDGAQ